MLQKVLKVGNSIAVTIPKPYSVKLKLSAGSQVNVNLNDEDKTMIIDPNPKTPKKGSDKLSPEFMAWADSFIEENRDLLKALANK